MTFKWRYAFLFVIVFLIEIAIALYVHDQFIRPFLGDVLVMVLMYAFIKSFVRIPPAQLTIALLLFAIAIEVSQYFNLVHLLNLDQNRVVRIVLGSTFDWMDILAYFVGGVGILWFEFKIRTRRNTNRPEISTI